MASTSDGTHGTNAVAEHETAFDWDQALADIASRRDVPHIFAYLEDSECNDPQLSIPQNFPVGAFYRPVDQSQTYRTPEFEGYVPGGPPDTNSGPMKLLNLAKQERDDLLLIHPEAKVQAECIETQHYISVLERFLFELKVSKNGIVEVPHPKAYARLFSRLSRELRSCFNDPDSSLDPADCAGCLGEILKDMKMINLEEDGKLLKQLEDIWGPNTYVHVRRATDKYVQCLDAAADKLSSR